MADNLKICLFLIGYIIYIISCSKHDRFENDLLKRYTEEDSWNEFRYNNVTNQFEKEVKVFVKLGRVFVYQLPYPREVEVTCLQSFSFCSLYSTKTMFTHCG